MIRLDVNAQGIEAIIAQLDPTEKQAKAALQRTLNRMAKWLQTRTAKGLSKELMMTQKIIRRRLKKSSIEKVSNGFAIKLWYGLNDIALIYLNPRKTKKGVTAGKHKRDGAFIAKGQVFKRKGKARLPLEIQVAEIKTKADQYLQSETYSVGFETQFFKTLEHELKWQMR